MAVMTAKIVEEVFILMEFEICTTEFHRDDLFVSQSRSKTAASEPILFFD
jgi:hypothetical protein